MGWSVLTWSMDKFMAPAWCSVKSTRNLATKKKGTEPCNMLQECMEISSMFTRIMWSNRIINVTVWMLHKQIRRWSISVNIWTEYQIFPTEYSTFLKLYYRCTACVIFSWIISEENVHRAPVHSGYRNIVAVGKTI